MVRNGPVEPRNKESRTLHSIRPVVAPWGCLRESIVWTPLDLLRLFPAMRAVHLAPTSTFPTHSWAWLFPVRPALPLGAFPVGSGAPLAFLCPRPGGEPAMQAAPAIAVQVFPLAGRPGPGLGASCLARQGTMERGRRFLVRFLCRPNVTCFRLGSNRLAVHPAPPFLRSTPLTCR